MIENSIIQYAENKTEWKINKNKTHYFINQICLFWTVKKIFTENRYFLKVFKQQQIAFFISISIIFVSNKMLAKMNFLSLLPIHPLFTAKYFSLKLSEILLYSIFKKGEIVYYWEKILITHLMQKFWALYSLYTE